jgi:hypothetical protein
MSPNMRFAVGTLGTACLGGLVGWALPQAYGHWAARDGWDGFPRSCCASFLR